MYFLLLGHMMQCREVFHVIGAPARCPQGYKHDYSGRCRKVFLWKQPWSRVSTEMKFEIQSPVGLRVEKPYCCLRNSLIASYRFDLISMHSKLIKIQLDAIVCSLIYFTAKSLYIFRVSTAPTIRNTKNCKRSLTATSFQRGQIWPRWKELAVPIL